MAGPRPEPPPLGLVALGAGPGSPGASAQAPWPSLLVRGRAAGPPLQPWPAGQLPRCLCLSQPSGAMAFLLLSTFSAMGSLAHAQPLPRSALTRVTVVFPPPAPHLPTLSFLRMSVVLIASLPDSPNFPLSSLSNPASNRSLDHSLSHGSRPTCTAQTGAGLRAPRCGLPPCPSARTAAPPLGEYPQLRVPPNPGTSPDHLAG